MTTIDSIIKWAETDLNKWQSDAVRRMLTQNSLTQKDEDEILKLLKQSKGIMKDGEEPLVAIPLKKGDVAGNQETSLKVALKAIKEIKSVNAIKDGSILEFGHEGLTVIYGENGAGKSGYARVLKKVCNARDSKEKILPNIYSDKSTGNAKATFKISKNDEPDINIPWEDDEKKTNGQLELLSSISFFDAKCANIIVDDNNNIGYLPFGTHVFGNLASLLKRIKVKLEEEKPNLEKPEYASIKPITSIGQFLENISHKTSIEEIKKRAVWETKDKEGLNQIISKITDAKVKDPIKQAKKIRATKKRIEEIEQNIDSLQEKFKKEKIENINNLIDKYKATQKALALASKDNLSEEPLQGAGSNEWQELYNAAKAYSVKHAYLETDYPNIDNDSMCVLCMQPLADDAKQRMQKFKSFMENETKSKAEAAEKRLKAAREYIDKIDILEIESYKAALEEIKERDEQLEKSIDEFVTYATSKRSEYLAALDDGRQIEPFLWEGEMKKSFQVIIDSLENEAIEKVKSAKPEELQKLEKAKDELEARKTFSENKDKYIQYIKDVQRSRKYQACINETSTRHISSTGRQIISAALTPVLQASLKKELANLRLSKLNIDLKASGVLGETKHQMKLQGCLDNKAKLTAVLSEGEQKVVALAGFLAELKINQTKCPIVFDDPVTSLDHRFREKIADRIVGEAKDRQVIVFTHDIAFLTMLRDKAGKIQTPLFVQEIQSRRHVGECLDIAWHALGVKDRLTYLNSETTVIRPLHERDMGEYNTQAGNIYGLLRETWEAFIEKTLLNQIVCRFSEEVRTQMVKSVEVTTEDYVAIEKGMSKCSKWMWGHDKSMSIDTNRPEPDELVADIAILKKLNRDVNNRNTETRRKREERLKPPTPEVG